MKKADAAASFRLAADDVEVVFTSTSSDDDDEDDPADFHISPGRPRTSAAAPAAAPQVVAAAAAAHSRSAGSNDRPRTTTASTTKRVTFVPTTYRRDADEQRMDEGAVAMSNASRAALMTARGRGAQNTRSRVPKAPVPPGAIRADAANDDVLETFPTDERPAFVVRRQRAVALATPPRTTHEQQQPSPALRVSPIPAPMSGDAFTDMSPLREPPPLSPLGPLDLQARDSAPPPRGVDRVLSSSDKSVKYRVDQHRRYFNNDATAAQALATDPRENSGSSNATASARLTVPSTSNASTAGPETVVQTEWSLTNLRLWIMRTQLGRVCSTAEKSSLHVAAGLCFVIIAAAVAVIIFGIVTLSMPNPRQELVNQYNAAAADFERSATIGLTSPILDTFLTGAAAVLRLSGAASATTLSFYEYTSAQLGLARQEVLPTGVTTGVAKASSAYLQAASVQISRAANVVVSLRVGVISGSTTNYNDISVAVPAAVTVDDAAPSTVLEPSQDPSAPQYLSSVCLVVAINPTTQLAELDPLQSCFFPFGKWQRYSLTQQSNIKVEVRLRGDPFVQLQALTNGRLAFTGTTKDRQNLEGGLSLAVAVLVLVPVILIVVPIAVELYARRNRLVAARQGRLSPGNKPGLAAVGSGGGERELSQSIGSTPARIVTSGGGDTTFDISTPTATPIRSRSDFMSDASPQQSVRFRRSADRPGGVLANRANLRSDG